MKSFIFAGLVAAVATAPMGSDSECAASADGKFTITTVKAEMSSKRDMGRRQLSGILTMSLKDGKLTDQAGRVGYIASNYQFQFDAPAQAGALETDGFGLCSNGSLSLMGSTLWYQCLSGNFYNLYSQSVGEQCIPIHIQAIMGGQNSGVNQIPDGQPQASAPAVHQIPDGQPQASAPAAAPPVMQIPDGQPQASAPAAKPPAPAVTSEYYCPPEPSVPAVTQISDGQPQVTAPPASPPNSTYVIPPVSTPAAPAPPTSTTVSTVVSTVVVPAPPASTAIVPAPPASTPAAPAPIATVPATVPVSNHTGNATSPPIPQFTGAAATTAASVGAFAAGFFALFSFL